MHAMSGESLRAANLEELGDAVRNLEAEGGGTTAILRKSTPTTS
jgi:hypothetical protein